MSGYSVHAEYVEWELTGGFTNQVVSHSRSFQRLITNWWTSLPDWRMASSSTSEPLALIVSLSIVTPQSLNAPNDSGSSDGDGGGANEPLNPQSPSWASLADTFSRSSGERDSVRLGINKEGGGRIGSLVHMSECSMSSGTGSPWEHVYTQKKRKL